MQGPEPKSLRQQAGEDSLAWLDSRLLHGSAGHLLPPVSAQVQQPASATLRVRSGELELVSWSLAITNYSDLGTLTQGNKRTWSLDGPYSHIAVCPCDAQHLTRLWFRVCADHCPASTGLPCGGIWGGSLPCPACMAAHKEESMDHDAQALFATY